MMEQLRNLSVAMESISACRKLLISHIRKGAVKEVVEAIRDEASRRAHDPSIQADFSHAKGQHKLALMFLIDAVFLNAQMDREDTSLAVDVRQAACRSISACLPDLVRNLTTPSNCEQVDRLLAGWRARKNDPRFDPVHITDASACMARAKAARLEQLKRRVAARFVSTSDDQQLPLHIDSMYGTFLPRGQPFGDPALVKPEHPVFEIFRRRLGQRFNPSMVPPSTLSFLKFNSSAVGRFQVPGDDPEAAPWEWVDEEELAVRQRLRAQHAAAAAHSAHQAADAAHKAQQAADAAPSTQHAVDAVHSAKSVRPTSSVAPATEPAQSEAPANLDPQSRPAVATSVPPTTPVNGVKIPGIPAKALPGPPKAGAVAAQSAAPEMQSARSGEQRGIVQQQRQEAEAVTGSAAVHGLPPPQTLPRPADLPPPSGNFAATPPWFASQGAPTPPAQPPPPGSFHGPGTTPRVSYHLLPPPAAPYADFAVYGDSGGYMPPLPSEPYDGDGSAPPPLPDEEPPLPDEPYEAVFPDSQEIPSTYGNNEAVKPGVHAGGAADPAPPAASSDLHASHHEHHGHPVPDPAYVQTHADTAAVTPAGPRFPPAGVAPPPYMQAPLPGYATLSPPANPAEAPPPLPPGGDGSPPPPLPPGEDALPPPRQVPSKPIRPPSHPPPFGVSEWGPQASPPSYPNATQHSQQHSQQHSAAYPGPDALYHTPSSSVYNMSPRSTSQEQVTAAPFPGAFPGSPERYSANARHEIFPPSGPPLQAGMQPPQMTPPRPLQPPPGNPPPIGANPAMHYPRPHSGFPYRGPPAGGPMHADPNFTEFHGWAPGMGYDHGQPPMGYALPPGHQPPQPPPMQQYGAGGYLPPPPPAHGGRGQMNGMPGGSKRPRHGRW